MAKVLTIMFGKLQSTYLNDFAWCSQMWHKYLFLYLQIGPSETNAALEFAVNTLEVSYDCWYRFWQDRSLIYYMIPFPGSVQVQNILVIGHSDCGGIQALMRMQDDVESRYWYIINLSISCAPAASDN